MEGSLTVGQANEAASQHMLLKERLDAVCS